MALFKEIIQFVPIHMNREDENVPASLTVGLNTDYDFGLTHREELLHSVELHHVESLKVKKRKTDYLMGRLCAKAAAAELLNTHDYSNILIASGTFRQPYVQYSSTEVPEISLTHSGGVSMALSCKSGHPVGIDLELIKSERQELMLKQMTDEEKETMQKIDLAPLDYSFMLWTIKESLSKATRCGLTVPLQVLTPKNLDIVEQDLISSTFQNFAQYKTFTWFTRPYCLSISLPKKTSLSIDIEKLKSVLLSAST